MTTGRAGEIENKVELVNTQSKDKGKFSTWKNNDLTLNYYLMSKNIDASLITQIKNNKKLIGIAEKKNMMPVSYDDVNKQVQYLKRNENKWK